MDICVSVIFRQNIFPIGMILELNSIFFKFFIDSTFYFSDNESISFSFALPLTLLSLQ
jgi:hypothetical protein